MLVYLMQRFTFVMDDPAYSLHLKQTLTIKPHDFYIHAIPRTDKRSIIPVSIPSSTLLRTRGAAAETTSTEDASSGGKKPMYVLYGSNTGTSESFAQQIASSSYKRGAPLDFNSNSTNTELMRLQDSKLTSVH